MTKTMMPHMVIQNSSVTEMSGSGGGRKMKRIQQVDSTMASASSKHYPAAILHTTRGTVKNNLTVKISKLANRHEAHG